MDSTLIIDPEITLKIREESDAERTFFLIDSNRAYLKQWLPWVDGVKTIQDCIDYIIFNRNEFDEEKAANYGIYYKGELVGLIGYHFFNRVNNATVLGYWLASEYQGKGIMTRSVSYLTNYAFQKLKMHRVEIQVAEGNKPSRAIVEKLGFLQEGISRDCEFLYDHYVNIVTYAKLETDR